MDYNNLVKSLTPKEKSLKNVLIAFLSGGVIGSISEVLVSCFNVDTMLIVWIFVASLLTGLCIFDDLADIFKMGVIIPITGFSHSVTSSMLEYKREGLITGLGSNYFKLAGSVILYGILSAGILAFIRGLLWIL